MSERIFNFSAGPGCLPESVLEQVRQDVWNIDGSGIGILEHSHRGKVVDRVFEECEADLRSALGVPDSHRILFMTGGASAQAFLVPMNFLSKDRTADYLVTGMWAQKAMEQAALFGNPHVAASSADANHNYIPSAEQTTYSQRPAYVHFTSNNTIFGTEFHAEPTPPEGAPLICDMSSDIASRPVDVSKYALIYAGAQKNLGPAGVTIVIAHDHLIESGRKDLPPLLQYRTFTKELSRTNTPPVFAVYVVGLVAKWLLEAGGLGAVRQINERKAKHIYDVLDRSSFYRGHARPDSRSLMNVTFNLPNEDLEKKFVTEAKLQGMDGLKGHRSVGGIRASIYNAFPEAGCRALAEFMREFERKHG